MDINEFEILVIALGFFKIYLKEVEYFVKRAIAM